MVWSFQSCHHVLLCPSAVFTLGVEGGSRRQQDQTFSGHPAIHQGWLTVPIRILSDSDPSQPQQDLRLRRGVVWSRWQPKGSEELGLGWAPAVRPQEDSGQITANESHCLERERVCHLCGEKAGRSPSSLTSKPAVGLGLPAFSCPAWVWGG